MAIQTLEQTDTWQEAADDTNSNFEELEGRLVGRNDNLGWGRYHNTVLTASSRAQLTANRPVILSGLVADVETHLPADYSEGMIRLDRVRAASVGDVLAVRVGFKYGSAGGSDGSGNVNVWFTDGITTTGTRFHQISQPFYRQTPNNTYNVQTLSIIPASQAIVSRGLLILTEIDATATLWDVDVLVSLVHKA